MPEDRSHFLNELAIWKLKIVAAEHKIDISDCRHKRDFVDKISSKKLTQEQILAALDSAQRKDAATVAGRRAEADIVAIGKDAEEIAGRATEPREIPLSEDEEVERYVEQTISTKPSFYPVDALTETAFGKLLLGEYSEAISASKQARMGCAEAISAFNIYSSAVSIRAAEELLKRLKEGGTVDSNLKTALAAAKKAFIGGTPRRREETLSDLENLALKAHEAAVTHAQKAEEDLSEALAEYESFGAFTQPARDLLDVASQARQTLNMKDHAQFVKTANEEAKRAKDQRVQDIAFGLKVAAAAVIEARELGADTEKLEADLSDAQKAFDKGLFNDSLRLYVAAEHAADAAHIQRLRSGGESEAQKASRLGGSLAAVERALSEAASYGIDVKDGAYYAGTARAALSRRDLVNAAKFLRLANDCLAAQEHKLDRERVERGLVHHVDDAKCGKCGKESLYTYPDGSTRCKECGHAFGLPAAASSPASAGTPEKKGSGPVSEKQAQISETPGKKPRLLRSLKKSQ